MKVCPKCDKSARVSERIEPDKVDKNKHWLITYCAKCGYNYDLEEYKDKYLSPQEEMDKFDLPKGKYWPTI